MLKSCPVWYCYRIGDWRPLALCGVSTLSIILICFFVPLGDTYFFMSALDDLSRIELVSTRVVLFRKCRMVELAFSLFRILICGIY